MGKKKRAGHAPSRRHRDAPGKRRQPPRGAKPLAGPRRELPTWKKLLFSLLATSIFFGAVELLLAIFGVEPVLYQDDPYVGFSSAVPHFVERTPAGGRAVMETANNKLRLFNRQSFARDKGDGVFRVFCLGGSTTYGRPYGDITSFCGWLRELLAAAEPSRTWEVVNAGGISYASYRVAMLMEELLDYQPDLFIVYTGHNEFLERRTYGRILAYPKAIRGLGALASRTRIFTAANQAIDRQRGRPANQPPAGAVLDADVRTLLDASVGPDAYTRDDTLAANVLRHYRFSLARMADMAHSAGAELVLVSPASNLRHCTPFKSEPTMGLDAAESRRWASLFEAAEKAADEDRWPEALAALDQAAVIEDRHAGAHYLRGRALDALGRHDQAKAAFARARDEDVCPLRALGQGRNIVAEVARERDVPLVDFVTLVENRSRQGIPGESLFLDHVHPTIEGARLLALEILETLRREGLVQPSPAWGPEAIQAVVDDVEGRLQPASHGLALSNLSKVLGWAGKLDEARKLSIRAARLAPESAQMHHQAALAAHLTGHLKEATFHYRKTIALAPATATAHSNLAVILDEAGNSPQAAVHYRRAIALLGDKNAAYRQQLQKALAKLANEGDLP